MREKHCYLAGDWSDVRGKNCSVGGLETSQYTLAGQRADAVN